MRILINGMGRIGKAIFKIASRTPSITIVAINEINPNNENIAYGINYDSTYGRLQDPFRVEKSMLIQDTTQIKILHEKSLEYIDFKSLGIDVVVDASGSSVEPKRLKALAVQAVFLTHPSLKADTNVILGVNEAQLQKGHRLISTSSCNATALLPFLDFVESVYGIKFGDIATIHPLLPHQKTLDSNCIGSQNREVECNFEFGRAALQNIIPSGTTTVEACSYIRPKLNNTILSSSSLRVPTPTVGAINVTLYLESDIEIKSFIEKIESKIQHQKHKVFMLNTQALVSSDFQAQEYTTIVDKRYTQVIQNRMLKTVIWYDNEYGYAHKVVQILQQYHNSNNLL